MAPPKIKGWSRRFKRCLKCGAPDTPGKEDRRHHGNGLCDICYVIEPVRRWRERQKKKRKKEERLKVQRK